jgi:hypothetical protein
MFLAGINLGRKAAEVFTCNQKEKVYETKTE